MEINNTEARLTPAEALWVLEACTRTEQRHAVAAKIVAASIKVVSPLSLEEAHELSGLSAKVFATPEDRFAQAALIIGLKSLYDAKLPAEDDSEHIINLELTEPEKQELLQAAKLDHHVATQHLELPELYDIEQRGRFEHYLTMGVISGAIDQQTATELDALLQVPEFRSRQYDISSRIAAATASIIPVLEDDQNK